MYESNRWCAVQHDRRPTPAKIRRAILREEGGQSGFSVLTAPAPAHDDTAFMVLGNEREVLVGIALFDSVKFLPGHDAEGAGDEVEILFDPMNDGIGWVQFYWGVLYKGGPDADDPHRDRESTDDVQFASHLPYPEAHSSACWSVGLKRYEVRDEDFSICPITKLGCRWLFAWFRTGEVFRNGPVCGFNVARNRPCLAEFSSWDYCSGNGSQDAANMGRLYHSGQPAHMSGARASFKGDALRVEGSFAGDARGLKLDLVGPTGESVPFALERNGGRWSGEAKVDARLGGRYRLYPRCGTAPVEPHYLAVDVPSRTQARSFCLSVTYDSPMSIVAGHYTPQRLARDMEIWAGLGIRRIHWIEYGDWPSFWGHAVYDWQDQYQRTVEHCGDYLTAGVRAAHAQGLELIADLKTFDLGMNCSVAEDDGVSAVPDLENKCVTAIPEIVAHPEWTMQSHPDWRREPSFPVTRLRIYSEAPIPDMRAADVRLLTSRDNSRYRPYRGRVTFRQGTLRRPHQRWTPAGPQRDRGTRKNWYVELSGLELNDPFVALRLGEAELTLRQRGFMLAEAWDGRGQTEPLTVATKGSAKGGFFFWKGWQGWSNQTEAILQTRQWDGRDLGLVFRQMPNMPTMLEPAFEGARNIWLARIATILDSGADGVDIRTYCHHNGPMSYLKYAYAGPVRDAFRSAYGRGPRCTPGDYERVRLIRGGFYTDFMRAARRLTASRGRKLIAELESGIEVPPSLDCRMQLHLDWRAWIREGLVDEVRVKWFTKDSTFVHEQVLPLARRHGVPVHVISRCLHTGFDVRAAEMAHLTIGGACAAGFAGYTFYEQQNLMDLNPEGRSTLKGPVRRYMSAAGEALRALAAGGRALT